MNRKGFTLMELLIVIAIIVILVAIAIPTFSKQLEKSREAVDVANIRAAYATVCTNTLTDDESEPITVNMKQKTEDWQTIGIFDALSHLGTVINHPTEGGTCEVSWIEDKVQFYFDGTQTVGYNFGDDRKSRMTTMARAFMDILADANPELVESFISGWSMPMSDNFCGDNSTFRYREIWMDPNGTSKLSNTYYYKDNSGKSVPYNISDMLKEKGVDYSGFKDSSYAGSAPVIYFDTNTNKPLAVSYHVSGNNGTYRYVYLEDGKTFDASNNQHRQYIVYHRDYAENHLTEVK